MHVLFMPHNTPSACTTIIVIFHVTVKYFSNARVTLYTERERERECGCLQPDTLHGILTNIYNLQGCIW